MQMAELNIYGTVGEPVSLASGRVAELAAVSVYPNPTSALLHPSGREAAAFRYTLFSATGAEVVRGNTVLTATGVERSFRVIRR